jgi:hypothetical protein
MKITLADHELRMAATVGLHRQLSALARGLEDKHGADPEEGWGYHIEGSCGELAVAKSVGRYWDGSVDTFRRIPDLGHVEIRTRSKHCYELIVRKDDDPEKIFIHVTGRAPHFWIRGWMKGADAQRDEWWQNHGDREWAWFVPNNELHTNWSRRTDDR